MPSAIVGQARQKRPASDYRRKKRNRRIIIIVGLVVAVVLAVRFFAPDRNQEATTPTDSASASGEATQTAQPTENDPLQDAVERLVSFYESPPSKQRTLMLYSLCLNDQACSLLGLSHDTKGLPKMSKTKVIIDPKAEQEFSAIQLDDEHVLVTTTTQLLVKPPKRDPYPFEVSLQTVWVKRNIGDWAFVGILFD